MFAGRFLCFCALAFAGQLWGMLQGIGLLGVDRDVLIFCAFACRFLPGGFPEHCVADFRGFRSVVGVFRQFALAGRCDSPLFPRTYYTDPGRLRRCGSRDGPLFLPFRGRGRSWSGLPVFSICFPFCLALSGSCYSGCGRLDLLLLGACRGGSVAACLPGRPGFLADRRSVRPIRLGVAPAMRSPMQYARTSFYLPIGPSGGPGD